MRRLLAVAVLASVALVPAGPGAARDPSAGGALYAEANWIDMHGTRGRWYTLQVHHRADAVSARLIAMLGVGRCRGEGPPRRRIIICTATLSRHALSPGAFRMDPLMEGATVRFTARGRRHEVWWDGRGTGPTPSFTAAPPPWAAAKAGLMRWARADGRVWGRSTEPMRDVLSWMEERGSFSVPPPGTRVERRFDLGR